MKKPTRVKFLPNWCSAEEGTKRLLDQLYVGQDLTDIEFVFGDEFDIIVYCGYQRGDAPSEAKQYIFNMEPSWSGNTQRSNAGMDAIIYAQTKEMFADPTNVIEAPTYMFYGAGGEGWVVSDTLGSYPKLHNISCIISGRQNHENISECIYDERVNMVDAILKSNILVDVFGRNCEFANCRGDLPRKIEGLKNHKFSIAVENSREYNYITEKFYDPILTNTIPIYYGAKNIKSIFPENGYFEIQDITDTDEILELLAYINDHADELYDDMLPELLKIKSRFFTEMNLLTKIIELARNNI